MAIDGTYKVEIETPMGKQEFKLTLKTDGNKLSGQVDSMLGKKDFTGTVKDHEVACKTEISSPVGKLKLDLNGKVSESEISGVVKTGNWGNFPYHGRKI